MSEIPKSVVRQFIYSAGIERTSKPAVMKLREVIERIGQRIAERSVEFAQHAGRATLQPEDVQLVLEEMQE